MKPEPVAPDSPVSGSVDDTPPNCIPLPVVSPPIKIEPSIVLSFPTIFIFSPSNLTPLGNLSLVDTTTSDLLLFAS